MSQKGLTVEYRETPLKAMDLKKAKRSFTSVVGFAGCGKTALLRVMASLRLKIQPAVLKQFLDANPLDHDFHLTNYIDYT